MKEQKKEIVWLLQQNEIRRKEVEKKLKENSHKYIAADMSAPLSPIPVPARKQLKYTAEIANGSVRESVAFTDQTRKMMPIDQMSMKKLAQVGHGGKLWRWKRSHHQWLLQFKWKWQKPWRLSEWIGHSDETNMRARPRPLAIPDVIPDVMHGN